ncbi:kinase [Sphingomonas sp. HITSZ_GF]|uniref:kinase n=1 Tax=Sphingomonas sp. HITSZ_GF TaxID=3037247 RepID=UPI00240DCEDF|nr:kinase [Sphingomonas sp. HITSZ_GF]MDG2535860.1 kinase [Sphingomonas sp. HITSZ_GF]
MHAVHPLPATDWITARLRTGARRPFVLGIAGAQGSGKTTIARALAARLGCPVLSLDDLYLDGAARQRLAETVHPLLRTRGVPGTHAVAAGLAVIEALAHGPTLLPRFDKARDEPGAPERVDGPAEMLILEGWCLGARPQRDTELAEPVNDLEREHDPDGRWRRWVNGQLAGAYQALWARIDQLIFLQAPGFEIVADWRIEQERNAGGPMADAEIRRFVQHYERLTRHMLRHGCDWADLTIELDAARHSKLT